MLTDPKILRNKMIKQNVRIYSMFLQFNTEKLGNQENIVDLHDKLLEYLEQLEINLNKTMASSIKCMQSYSDNMQRSFENITSYLNQSSLDELHENAKNQSMSQVCVQVHKKLHFKSFYSDYLFKKIYQ